MRGRAPDPGRSVKAIKRDKQRRYAGLEYYGKTADMSWFKRKPYDIKQNRKGDDQHGASYKENS